MQIQIHQYNATYESLTLSDTERLINIIDIPIHQFKPKGYGDHRSLKYTFDKAVRKMHDTNSKESVYLQLGRLHEPAITISSSTTDSYSPNSLPEPYYMFPRLTLHGSYFDVMSDACMGALLEFGKAHNTTPKQLDLCFIDDEKHTSPEDWKRWMYTTDWKNYCTGSLFRVAPRPIVEGGRFYGVWLCKPTNTQNYATIYVRPDGELRYEIKFTNTFKIQELLKHYNSNDQTKFHEVAVSALVSCCDFVNPKSKRSRTPSKYVRDPAYQAFIGSEPTKINWSQRQAAAKAVQKQSTISSIGREIAGIHGWAQNLSTRCEGLILPLEYRKQIQETIEILKPLLS